MVEGRPTLITRARNSSSTSQKFPLPLDFFPRADISLGKQREWEEEADLVLNSLIDESSWSMSNEDSTRGWKLASSQRQYRENGVRTYCRKSQQPHQRAMYGTSQLEVKSLGRVSLPLREALPALHADSTSDLRSGLDFLLGNQYVDSAVLSTMTPRSNNHHASYLGLHWAALRSNGVFGKKRDFCYLKKMGSMINKADGQELGFVLLHSVDEDACKPLDNTLGLTRSRISGVLLLKERQEGRTTDVMWHGWLTSPGSTSSSKTASLINDAVASLLSKLHRFVEIKYVTKQIQQSDKHPADVRVKGNRKRCSVCMRKFNIMRTRRQCGACGAAVCKDCEVSGNADLLEAARQPEPTDLKGNKRHFCSKCMEDAWHEMENQAASRDSPDDRIEKNLNPSSRQPSRRRSTLNEEASSGRSTEHLSMLSSDLNSPMLRADVPPTTTRSSLPKMMIYGGDACASTVPPSPGSAPPSSTKRSRLESDSSEVYDEFDSEDLRNKPRESTSESFCDEFNTFARASTSSAGSMDQYADSRDFASRLWEISVMAQETLDTTRRNSNLMSDTSSQRTSEVHQFSTLDNSIAEQAEMLNVLSYVSTGKVYMENDEYGGVRASDASDASDRFEVIT